MSTHTRAFAEAFSGHRLRRTYQFLAPDVQWRSVGEGATVGRDAVIAACECRAADLATTTTEFTRFVIAADDDTAAVDATSRYTDPDGTTSVVSSCDIYECPRRRGHPHHFLRCRGSKRLAPPDHAFTPRASISS